MSRVRRNERRTGTNTAVDAATNTCAWRSNQTTRTGTDSGDYDAHAESLGASGNTANKSDSAAGSYCAARTKTIANTSGRERARRIECAQRSERAFARTGNSAVSSQATAAGAESESFRCGQ